MRLFEVFQGGHVFYGAMRVVPVLDDVVLDAEADVGDEIPAIHERRLHDEASDVLVDAGM